MRINHMFVGAIDVERSTRFYCDLFGFVPTKIFNEGHGDCQIIHWEAQGRDLDLLLIPLGTPKLPYAHHLAFEAESAEEFQSRFETSKAMGLKPRSGVPLDSEPGISTFSMNGKTYQHFYVLDPSWVNIEIMVCLQK